MKVSALASAAPARATGRAASAPAASRRCRRPSAGPGTLLRIVTIAFRVLEDVVVALVVNRRGTVADLGRALLSVDRAHGRIEVELLRRRSSISSMFACSRSDTAPVPKRAKRSVGADAAMVERVDEVVADPAGRVAPVRRARAAAASGRARLGRPRRPASGRNPRRGAGSRRALPASNRPATPSVVLIMKRPSVTPARSRSPCSRSLAKITGERRLARKLRDRAPRRLRGDEPVAAGDRLQQARSTNMLKLKMARLTGSIGSATSWPTAGAGRHSRPASRQGRRASAGAVRRWGCTCCAARRGRCHQPLAFCHQARRRASHDWQRHLRS